MQSYDYNKNQKTVINKQNWVFLKMHCIYPTYTLIIIYNRQISFALLLDVDREGYFLSNLAFPSQKNYKKNTANVHILVELQIYLIHFTDPNCVSIGNGCFLADPLCDRYINLYLNDN